MNSPDLDQRSVTVLAGGVGAARLLRGVLAVVPPERVTAVVNTADDAVINGLAISPDLDTITYTLADAIDPERGWGLVDETWRAIEGLGRYAAVKPATSHAAATWFNLGDRDLATHMYRTARRMEGATLTEITAEIARAWGLGLTLLPMTDGTVATRLTRADTDEVLAFQEYFVRHRHGVPISAITFDHNDAELTDRARDAIITADVVIIAPSNPLVSIGPIRSLPGVDDLLADRRDTVVAVSPLVGGAALKGPADRLMTGLGFDPSVVGVARIYSPVAGRLVLDTVDGNFADQVRSVGVEPLVTETVMSSIDIAASLARVCLS